MNALIETDGLRKHYKVGESTVKALDGVSIAIGTGEFVALQGTSGSGKSTLLNLIAGLDCPTHGTLVFQKQELTQLSRYDLSVHRQRHVGIVFQSFNLISTMSAAENVALPMMFAGIPPRQRHSRSQVLLESVGLGERHRHKPSELSGGEQQRVAIARALANDPQLILADEPTGNVDSRTAADIMRLFKDLNTRDGKTVIVATHDSALVSSFASRTVTLLDGCVLQDETSS